jgi:hypothetical protein
MQNLKRIFRTKKHKSYMLVFLFLFLLPQYSFPLDDPALTSSSEQIVADSVFNACSDRDSVIQSYFSKLNINHKSRPIHPYFRDSYRVILDMRQLVRIFDYHAVNGYESMNDLVEIYRKFPEHKQAEMIYTAMAGGVVNLISERTNKELRKRKIHFLQKESDFLCRHFEFITTVTILLIIQLKASLLCPSETLELAATASMEEQMLLLSTPQGLDMLA